MDENDDVVGESVLVCHNESADEAAEDDEVYRLPTLDGDLAQCYYSVFVAEVCSHANADQSPHERVDQAAYLAEIAAARLSRRLAVGREQAEADNDANDACHGS